MTKLNVGALSLECELRGAGPLLPMIDGFRQSRLAPIDKPRETDCALSSLLRQLG